MVSIIPHVVIVRYDDMYPTVPSTVDRDISPDPKTRIITFLKYQNRARVIRSDSLKFYNFISPRISTPNSTPIGPPCIIKHNRLWAHVYVPNRVSSLGYEHCREACQRQKETAAHSLRSSKGLDTFSSRPKTKQKLCLSKWTKQIFLSSMVRHTPHGR